MIPEIQRKWHWIIAELYQLSTSMHFSDNPEKYSKTDKLLQDKQRYSSITSTTPHWLLRCTLLPFSKYEVTNLYLAFSAEQECLHRQSATTGSTARSHIFGLVWGSLFGPLCLKSFRKYSK